MEWLVLQRTTDQLVNQGLFPVGQQSCQRISEDTTLQAPLPLGILKSFGACNESVMHGEVLLSSAVSPLQIKKKTGQKTEDQLAYQGPLLRDCGPLCQYLLLCLLGLRCRCPRLRLRCLLGWALSRDFVRDFADAGWTDAYLSSRLSQAVDHSCSALLYSSSAFFCFG